MQSRRAKAIAASWFVSSDLKVRTPQRLRTKQPSKSLMKVQVSRRRIWPTSSTPFSPRVTVAPDSDFRLYVVLFMRTAGAFRSIQFRVKARLFQFTCQSNRHDSRCRPIDTVCEESLTTARNLADLFTAPRFQ